MADKDPTITPEQVKQLVESGRICAERVGAALRVFAEQMRPVIDALAKLAEQQRDAIYWHAIPDSNALVFEHVGCDGSTYKWIVPLDDVPLPLADRDEECANCCHVRPLREGPVIR